MVLKIYLPYKVDLAKFFRNCHGVFAHLEILTIVRKGVTLHGLRGHVVRLQDQ